MTSLPLRSQRGIKKCVELICCVKIRRDSNHHLDTRVIECEKSATVSTKMYTGSWCKLMPNVNRPLVSYPICILKKTGGHEYVTMRFSG